MNGRFVVIAGLLAASAATAGAQCASAPVVARQSCYASVDLINYMTPQLATGIAGGSSTLAQSGALGGLGRFALTLRGTGVLDGAFPNIGDVPFKTDGSKQAYTTKDQIVPGVGVDASIGLWKGLNLGATHVGGVDAIVSALYVPDVTGDGNDFSIKAKDGNLKLGYGVRVGLLDESVITPGVYASYLQRDLPTVTLSGKSGGSGVGSGTFALNDFSVKTTAVRLVAQKSLLILGLTAGVGQDTYKSSANIATTVSGQSASGAADMSMTRTNMFVGASFNLFIFKVAVEYGQVSGGSVAAPFNTFDKAPDASHKYLSGGIRLAF